MKLRVLIIGLVWPEPTSSAAGWRMLQLIDELKKISNDIHFACAASKSVSSHSLEKLNVITHDIFLNDASFNDFIADLLPDVVVYDRFITEEQFGWRIKQLFPNIVSVLDTEDLHFVRRARTTAFKTNTKVNYDTADCYRELSSIYRSDLSIIISKSEYDLLINHFNIPAKQLLYLPFIEAKISNENKEKLPNFNNRKDFMFIGNFIHEPNYQTVLQLKKIWTSIRKRLPNIQIHIYGAYASQKVLQLNNVNDGFIIKGKADDVNQIMQQYRVLVAPIPFGAGLKGKFVDGFRNSLPNVTSKIGAEGISAESWGGFIAENETDFVDAVCKLYNDETEWNKAVTHGFDILSNQFSEEIWSGVLKDAVLKIHENIEPHRSNLFIQKILWQNGLQAVKYISLWIEQKNK